MITADISYTGDLVVTPVFYHPAWATASMLTWGDPADDYTTYADCGLPCVTLELYSGSFDSIVKRRIPAYNRSSTHTGYYSLTDFEFTWATENATGGTDVDRAVTFRDVLYVLSNNRVLYTSPQAMKDNFTSLGVPTTSLTAFTTVGSPSGVILVVPSPTDPTKVVPCWNPGCYEAAPEDEFTHGRGVLLDTALKVYFPDMSGTKNTLSYWFYDFTNIAVTSLSGLEYLAQDFYSGHIYTVGTITGPNEYDEYLLPRSSLRVSPPSVLGLFNGVDPTRQFIDVWWTSLLYSYFIDPSVTVELWAVPAKLVKPESTINYSTLNGLFAFVISFNPPRFYSKTDSDLLVVNDGTFDAFKLLATGTTFEASFSSANGGSYYNVRRRDDLAAPGFKYAFYAYTGYDHGSIPPLTVTDNTGSGRPAVAQVVGGEVNPIVETVSEFALGYKHDPPGGIKITTFTKHGGGIGPDAELGNRFNIPTSKYFVGNTVVEGRTIYTEVDPTGPSPPDLTNLAFVRYEYENPLPAGLWVLQFRLSTYREWVDVAWYGGTPGTPTVYLYQKQKPAPWSLVKEDGTIVTGNLPDFDIDKDIP